MAMLSTLKETHYHRVCVFGPPKSGKTEIVGKLSKHYNLHWLDLENGHLTLTKLPQDWQARINLIRIRDTRTLPIATETVMKVLTGPTKICWEHGKVNCPICLKNTPENFDTINVSEFGPKDILVIDSLTQLSNSIMAVVTKGKPDDYKFEWDDCRAQGTRLDLILSLIQQANFNCVCITHEAEVELDDKSKKLVPVAGTANFSRNTAKYFDHVVYCGKVGTKHIAASSTSYKPNILTGSRSDAAVEKSAEPSLFEIFGVS